MSRLESKLWWTIWIAVAILNFGKGAECSGDKGIVGGGGGGKSSGLWGYVSSIASAVFMGKVDNEPSYGRLFQFERKLHEKFKAMGSELAKNPALITESSWAPIKFPEASAFSALFIRDIGAHLDTWMDLSESKKLREGSKILSQHILWVRSCGSKAATSYFIYRPSFEAQLESSNILPHIQYHSEALETAQKVIEVIQAFPNDQIIFAGLQSGGIIAMLHAWMAVASVPIVFHNLKEFKGELHQIKVFLLDSDCALSESHAPDFPIPSWDVLRFYSGMTGDALAERCKFESMKPYGLSYAFKPTWTEYFLPSSSQVDRTMFVDYFDKSDQTRPLSSENIDNGIDEGFDDAASIAPSEISMSVDGNRQLNPLSQKRDLPISHSPLSKNFEDIIKPGIELLRQSVSLAKFFFTNLKEIYRTHQTFYLRRNVSGCAAAMQKNLINTLLGKEKESPIVEKGIKDVVCGVESYNEKTKVALILCTLESKDFVKIPVLRFRTHVQNEMDEILVDRSITVVENEWEEVSLKTVSTSESFAGARPRAGTQEDVYFDDRTQVTGWFPEKSVQWAACLEELFLSVPHLNFIKPNTASNPSSSFSNPGSSTLRIQLPFSSISAVCEFSLLTQPKNFYQLYSVSSSMFFSIFSDIIETRAIPQVCVGVLEPPSIPDKNAGNAELFAHILNGYFNFDGTSRINHKNTIVNGLELQESITNLPSNNPYEIFTPPLCNLLAGCLAQNTLGKKLYDCNSHITLWAGKHHCPEVCRFRPATGKNLHLCSRVADCGEGVYLGFRGCKTFGTERPLAEEFVAHSVLNQFTPASYYAAFHLRHVDGWSSTLKKPFRFSVFMSESAKNNFINPANAVGSDQSVSVSSRNSQSDIPIGLLSKKESFSERRFSYSYDESYGDQVNQDLSEDEYENLLSGNDRGQAVEEEDSYEVHCEDEHKEVLLKEIEEDRELAIDTSVKALTVEQDQTEAKLPAQTEEQNQNQSQNQNQQSQSRTREDDQSVAMSSITSESITTPVQVPKSKKKKTPLTT